MGNVATSSLSALFSAEPGSLVAGDGCVMVGRRPDAPADPPIRFHAQNARGHEWPADGTAGQTERWVSLWRPLSVDGGPWVPAVRSDVALLRADTPANAGAMLSAYKRGNSYSFVNRTEIYVVELRAATDGTHLFTQSAVAPFFVRMPEYVIASKAAFTDAGSLPGDMGLKVGSILVCMDSEGTVLYSYYVTDGFNTETAEFTPSLSHRHPTLAVIVTQWAGNELRLWYNGYMTSSPNFLTQQPYNTPHNNFEAMLLGVGDADGNPTAMPVHPRFTSNARIREVAIFPDYVMGTAEVQQRTLEYWMRYANGAPARVRYHCGLDIADTRPHLQLEITGQPPLSVFDDPTLPDEDRWVRGWFGEPYPAAMWRRWITVCLRNPGTSVLWRGVTIDEPPHLYVEPGGEAVLAMLGPSAGNGLHTSVTRPVRKSNFANMEPGFGVSLGDHLPFTFRRCTAALVLRASPGAGPQVWFSRAAHDPAAAPGPELRLGAHSVALWQTPAPGDELALGLWGPTDAADPVAVARVPIAAAVAAGQRLAVVVRLDDHLTLAVGGVGTDRVPLPPLGPDPLPPYELVLFGHGDARGFPTGTGSFTCQSGRLYEVRLYERELLTDAAVTTVLTELRAAYQTV